MRTTTTIQDKIKNYWDEQANEHGQSSMATVPDQYAKDLEVENILPYLTGKVLDVGCGNGYSTAIYAQGNIKITGMDYSERMIDVANIRDTPATFLVGDVTNIPFRDGTFDTVTTDRCLINLSTREQQALAVKELCRVLKPGGCYVMCENTERGLDNLNSVRELAGLGKIETRWHNMYLDEQHILGVIEELFIVREIKSFASFYYLASRVINAGVNKNPRYDSDINRVAAKVSSHVDAGDYGPVKLFILEKKC